MGSTWDALKRAEQGRTDAVAAQSGALDELAQDIAALQVSVHSLEDRIELELGGLSDELRQSIAKARDLVASRGTSVEERLIAELGWVSEVSARGERRLNAILALIGITALLALFRC